VGVPTTGKYVYTEGKRKTSSRSARVARVSRSRSLRRRLEPAAAAADGAVLSVTLRVWAPFGSVAPSALWPSM